LTTDYTMHVDVCNARNKTAYRMEHATQHKPTRLASLMQNHLIQCTEIVNLKQ